MTYAPDDITAALAELHAQGAPWDALGCVGDAAHIASGGYHVGRVDLAAARRLRYDYSVVESPRDARPTDAASALDFAGASWWRPLTLWLVDACRAGAPGTEDIREVIYTPDGATVQRWDRLGVRTTGDSSHLWHTHVSFFRDAEGRRGTFLALLQRFFAGEPATPPAQPIDTGDDDNMSTGEVRVGYAFGRPEGRNDLAVTGVGLGPVNGGEFHNRRCVLGLGADFTPKAGVELRVAIHAPAGWGVKHYTIHAPDERLAIFLPDGATKITIGRVMRGEDDQDTVTRDDGSVSVVADAATCPVWWDLEPEKR